MAERQCIACRRRAPKGQLLRLVRAPEGEVVFDLAQGLPGRGAYLCPARTCLDRGLRPAAAGRAFRAPVRLPAPEEALPRLREQALRQLREAVGVYARGDALVAGAEAVAAALGRGPAAGLLVLAEDAGEATARRGRRLAAEAGLPLLVQGAAADWGAALGRRRCALLWVRAPRAAKRIEWLLHLAAATRPGSPS